jgi:16S rRNA A1518/A1519 N6-dimethyltransferase RsmA/KsgA/DIM1 with predicted DNA glycosylase/AP lyase activity
MSVLEIIPKIKSGLTAPVDILQHLLVLLFTKKRQPIRVAIKSVAPSAEELLDGVDIDPEIRPYDLNLKQLDELAIKFRDWYCFDERCAGK